METFCDTNHTQIDVYPFRDSWKCELWGIFWRVTKSHKCHTWKVCSLCHLGELPTCDFGVHVSIQYCHIRGTWPFSFHALFQYEYEVLYCWRKIWHRRDIGACQPLWRDWSFGGRLGRLWLWRLRCIWNTCGLWIHLVLLRGFLEVLMKQFIDVSNWYFQQL